jgi:hypothetical protein
MIGWIFDAMGYVDCVNTPDFATVEEMELFFC